MKRIPRLSPGRAEFLIELVNERGVVALEIMHRPAGASCTRGTQRLVLLGIERVRPLTGISKTRPRPPRRKSCRLQPLEVVTPRATAFVPVRDLQRMGMERKQFHARSDTVVDVTDARCVSPHRPAHLFDLKSTTRQVTETLGFPGVLRRGWLNCPVGSAAFRVLHPDQVLIQGEFGGGSPAIRYPTLLYA